MGERNLAPEKEEEEKSVSEAEVNSITLGDGAKMPAIRKDPSFSRWFDEKDGFSRSIPSANGSCECGTADGSEEFDLPLLQVGGSERAHRSLEGQWSNGFRQRSMTIASLEGSGDGKRYIPLPLDIENGIHTTDSIAKPESLDTDQNSITYVILLKTLFFILIWYTFSTCLTL